MSPTVCPSIDDLSRLRFGKLTNIAAQETAQHLNYCDECEAIIDSIDDSKDTLALCLRQPPSHNPIEDEPEFGWAMTAIQTFGNNLSSSIKGAPRETIIDDDLGPAMLREYELLEKLGEGGMGTVYKARHAKLKRIVALKVLAPDRTQSAHAIARFEKEMEAVGKFEHPNIVRALDAGEHKGTHYLVMEYVEGIDLSSLVAKYGRLSIADACELVRQAAVGLHHAHENSLVHRDIKPSNLMLTTGPSGPQVKLLDLGLALLCGQQSAVNGITGSNQMMGTADYMAPEQVGDSPTIDIRADVYSLGCTLYKLITGHAPFCGSQYGSSLQKMVGHLRDSIPPVTNHRRDVPTALVPVLDRMLAKRPDDRFATPAEVVAAIAPFCMGHSLKRLTVSARDPATDLRSRVPCKLDDTPSRRPPRRLFIASAAAASLLILAGIIVTIKDRDGHTVAKYFLHDGDSITIESERIAQPDNDKAAQPDNDKAAQLDNDKAAQPDNDSVRRLATRALLEQVSASVIAGKTIKSDIMGSGQEAYEEVPKEGALLIGFDVTYGKFGDSPTVTTFRPIFLTRKGRITGTTHGNPGEGLIRVEAKPGYAVGALTIKAGIGVDGMSVTFMEIGEEGLNPNRTYESEWLGGMGGDEKKKIAGTGAPVVGIFGATAEGTSTFNGLGVVTAEVKAAQPDNDKAAQRDNDSVRKSPGKNLLANGSFEDAPPAINDGNTNINLAKGSDDLKGWTIDEPGCGIIDSTYWKPAEGNRSLALSNFGVVSQQFDTRKDQKYRVTFRLAGDPLGPGEAKTLRLRAAGQGAEFKFDSTGKSRQKMDWVQKSWEFTAKSDQTVLEFSGQTPGLWGPALDDINVAPVSD